MCKYCETTFQNSKCVDAPNVKAGKCGANLAVDSKYGNRVVIQDNDILAIHVNVKNMLLHTGILKNMDFVHIGIRIKYCPMCGRKLMQEVTIHNVDKH